jgi:ABC-type multidrug transport system fused ATPase/permease subunit
LGGFQQIVSQLVLILITVAAILIYNPVLFPVLFIILTPPLIFTGYLMKRKLNAIRKTAKPVSEKAIQYLKEALSGFIEGNLYDTKPFFANRYHVSQSKFNHFLSEQQVVQNMPSRLMEIFAILGLGMLIAVNSFISHTHSLPIITIGAFMAAAYKIIPGIVKILNSSGQMKTYEFTVHDLLRDSPVPVSKSDLPGPALLSFSFERVFFSFKNGPLLKDLSFSVSKGDFVGLSAVSGKGKTTLVNLLLGFLEPESGAIKLNGVRVAKEERQRFWKRISYVTQQPLLICDTILKNVALEETHFDFQRLEEVIRITGLKELITNYAEGFNKIIAENGRNLSGGQRQRMTIARALYRHADLIILDEPFSELDRDSENELLRFFSELALEGKIILLITHNRESLSFCNKIISLDEKRTALFGDIDPRFS